MKIKQCNVCKRNACAPGRGMCYKCKSRTYREKNKMRAAYHNLKRSAVKRGKHFAISFEYFKQFATEFNYIQGKNRSKTGYSVDCKINELGYVEGNLQILTVSANASKGTKKLEYDYRTGEAIVTSFPPIENNENLPF